MPRIEPDVKLDFQDVLFKPKRSTLNSRSQVILERTFHFKNSKRDWTGIPIISANMDTTGTFEMFKVLRKAKMITALHKHYTLKDYKGFIDFLKKDNSLDDLDFLAISSGTSKEDQLKLIEILELIPVYIICLDVANGYSEHFVDFVEEIRQLYPSHIIMAGNVVTSEMTEELLLKGADVVKIGIGGGSVCTTRKQTGVGYPQLSAIIECADSAHGLNGHIISDGGCTTPGDICKAFGGGADFVMLGGMLSGHEESGGETVIIEGKTYREFYGMSSEQAMIKYSGSVANYRSSEGKRVLVPYKGKVSNTINDILGGLRSMCTYIGALCLKEVSKRTTFIRVSRTKKMSS